MVKTSTPQKNKYYLHAVHTLLLLLFCSFSHLLNAATITGNISVCAGETLPYSVPAVTGGNYIWTVSNGNVVGLGNSNAVNIHFDTSGAATINVVITDINNIVTTGTLAVTLHPLSVPHITWPAYPTCPDAGEDHNGTQGHVETCINVCKNAIISYSTPLHAGSTYLWVPSGNINLIGQGTNNVTVYWDSTAFGSLTIIETNAWGCVDSAHICIKKVDIPTALFSQAANVCLSTATNFLNLSTGATSYQWYFGDGGSSTAVNPVYSYPVAGTYTITLIAYNACHCTDTFRSTITVDARPGPDIECPATVCAGDTETYYTNATGCVYNWIVTGGTIISPPGLSSITVAWGPGMIGHVSLFVTGCGAVCSDTTTVIIPIIPSVATITGPNKVCPGDCEKYSIPLFMGSVYSWSISGSGVATTQNCNCNEIEICWPSYISFENDTLNVSYFDTFLNCGGTGQMIIHVRPQLLLNGATTVCANSTTPVYAVPGVACNWNITPGGPTFTGNGSPSISVSWNNIPGNYTVTAVPIAPNQVCNDSVQLNIKAVPVPVKPVITGDTIICPGTTYNYCATGTNVKWFVIGGTPSTGTGNCINIIWNIAGPYAVQAIQQMSSSPNCPSDTTTLAVQSALPVGNPNITGPNNVCANGTNIFINTVSYPPFATYNWSLGLPNAGSVINGQGTTSVTVQWGNNAPAIDTVRLEVGVCNQVLTAIKVVNLFAAPNPTIVVNGTFCAGTSVTLTAIGGAYTAYQWSGPGFSSITNPSSSVTAQGPYHVTVTDVNGCTGSATKALVHLPGPVASISTSDPVHYCVGTPFVVTLNALSNPNYTYSWSNGSVGNPITVNTGGTYWVTVTDQNGCTTQSNLLTIFIDPCVATPPCTPNGTVSFIHPTFYGCNPVSFTNTSVNASTYTWNFGDGLFANTTNATHTYAIAGFYLVTLRGYVLNAAGTDSCLLQDTAHVEIPLAPRFKFIAGCAQDPVCFTDLSTFTPGNSITGWSWNFGDATSSTLQNPCHTYAVGGTYTVTLTITNGSCFSSYSTTVQVLVQPVAGFTFSSPSCVNNNVPFTDASTPAGINYWSWTFGDGGTSLNQNPNHSYSSANNYNVQLVVKDTSGCTDTALATITIVGPAITGVITAFPDTIVCPKTNVLLVAPACICTYQWNTGSTNDSITVSSTGTYTVTITDANGCTATRKINILVQPGPTVSISNYGADKFCLGGSTYLAGYYSVNYLYSWITTDVVNNGSNASGIYIQPTAPGVYQFVLSAIDTVTGCADTSLPYYITVTDTPVTPVITAIGATTVCEGDTITLVVTHPDSTVTIHWNNGEVTDTIRVTMNGCYTATIVDTNGCDNSAVFCVTVNPMPDICPFWTGCLDTCRPFTIMGPYGNASYQWLLNGAPIAGATLQNYTATVNGAYSLILTNSFGCTDTTGVLDLTLHDCNECVDVVTDSVYCDSAGGGNIFMYHIVNHSGHAINQTNLLVLTPHLNTLYAPVTSMDTVLDGHSSIIHTAHIYNENPGTVLCFMVHVQELDSNGTELFCCNSDTDCITLPPCDSVPCCYLHVLSDSVWCTGQDSVGQNTYGFSAVVNGCGHLHLTTPSGAITTNLNYNLAPGITTISGSFTDIPPVNGSFCLGFIMGTGTLTCFDTTICMTLPHCDTACCFLHIISDTVTCKGVDTAGNNIYSFQVVVNGCGHLILQTPSGTILSPTNFTLNPGLTTINGTFVNNPPVNGSFCLTFLLTNAGAICADTTVCMHLPVCRDSLPVLPECYLEFHHTICVGQSATFVYSGNPAGLTFNWVFTGGVPATATGAGPHAVTYPTVGCYPVTLYVNNGNHTTVCHDSICVVPAPVATINQVGSALYAYPAGMSYQWYNGPPTYTIIPNAVNQFYNPVVTGVYCAVVTNNAGCSDTVCRDYIPTGINDVSGDYTWSIVPNPNNGNFEIVIESAISGRINFSITNTMGQLILQNDLDVSSNSVKRIPLMQNMAAGIYFIKLESEKRSSVQKMVVR